MSWIDRSRGEMSRSEVWVTGLMLLCCGIGTTQSTVCVSGARASDTLAIEEESAFRVAADRAAGAVVRIEAIGASADGIGGVAEAAPATGSSSGLSVAANGWILTTSFAVPKDATQAIVLLPSGMRQVARVVARDLSRGLVLLKIDLQDGAELPVPAVSPRSELAVGQWTIAMGRAINHAVPSMAVGILSATNRAWGRAVQSDASVSPANYGGPLIDIQGRVIGILAPLPADTAGMMTGTELYDSGIGFAVPLEDVMRVLPRLQQGESLFPGILGIGYQSRDLMTAPAVVASCRAGSPAAQAGLRPGDTIVEADGRPVTRIAELRQVLVPHYAGDTIDLVVERRADNAAPHRITSHITLAASLPPWRRAVLGIVPSRSVRPQSTDEGDREGHQRNPKRGGPSKGVTVAWVWPDTPAAKAGVIAGDVIVSIEEQSPDGRAGGTEKVPVDSAAMLAGLIGGMEIGQRLRLSVLRGKETLLVEVAPAAMPVAVPENMPISDRDVNQTTIQRLEAPEVAKPPLAVLPAASSEQPLGVLVFFGMPAAAADQTDAARAAVWKAAATRYGVAVILPGSNDPQRWGREDMAHVARAIESLRSQRPIDPSRVAFAGRGAGGSFAWLAAEAIGPAVHGVAILDATLPRQAIVEPAEPGGSRSVLLSRSSTQPVPKLDADRKRLEEAGYPVGILPDLVGDSIPTEILCGWVESLGVL